MAGGQACVFDEWDCAEFDGGAGDAQADRVVAVVLGLVEESVELFQDEGEDRVLYAGEAEE